MPPLLEDVEVELDVEVEVEVELLLPEVEPELPEVVEVIPDVDVMPLLAPLLVELLVEVPHPLLPPPEDVAPLLPPDEVAPLLEPLLDEVSQPPLLLPDDEPLVELVLPLDDEPLVDEVLLPEDDPLDVDVLPPEDEPLDVEVLPPEDEPLDVDVLPPDDEPLDVDVLLPDDEPLDDDVLLPDEEPLVDDVLLPEDDPLDDEVLLPEELLLFLPPELPPNPPPPTGSEMALTRPGSITRDARSAGPPPMPVSGVNTNGVWPLPPGSSWSSSASSSLLLRGLHIWPEESLASRMRGCLGAPDRAASFGSLTFRTTRETFGLTPCARTTGFLCVSFGRDRLDLMRGFFFTALTCAAGESIGSHSSSAIADSNGRASAQASAAPSKPDLSVWRFIMASP